MTNKSSLQSWPFPPTPLLALPLPPGPSLTPWLAAEDCSSCSLVVALQLNYHLSQPLQLEIEHLVASCI